MLSGAMGRQSVTFKLESLEPRRLFSAAIEDVAAAVEVPEATVLEWKQRSFHFERNEAIAASPDGVYRDELGRFEANLAPGEYSVMIDWGDGTTSAGWLVDYLQEPFHGQSYGVHVRGGHVYAEPGVYKVVATVTASDGQSRNFYQDMIPFASPIQLLNQHAYSLGIQDHRVTYRALVFGHVNIEELTGTIDWGDGTTTQVAAGEELWSGAIPLGADHIYAEPGTYTITFTARAPMGSAGETTSMTATRPVDVGIASPWDFIYVAAYGAWAGERPIDLFEEPTRTPTEVFAPANHALPRDAPPPAKGDSKSEAETLISLLDLESQAGLT